MPQKIQPLADDFTPPTLEQWRALAGKSAPEGLIERLAWRTADGLEVAPLHTAEDAVRPLGARPAPAADPSRPWDLRAPLCTAEPVEAAAEAREHLEHGAASVLLACDPAAPDHTPVRDGDDLARALEGVLPEAAPVALDAGAAGAEAANWLAVWAKGAPAAPLAFHLDPLSAAARDPELDGAGLLAEAAQAAARHAPAYPRASLFLASGRFAHEAGGSEAQELGAMAASAVAALRALEAAGLAPDQALPRIVLGLSADAEYFTTLAKLRAARAIWARIATACGVEAPARIEARSSRRMLARMDRWTNLLRLTAAAFGAGVGGAEAVILDPFDQPLGPPTPLARRQLRNIQLVLMEEAHLGRVADPAGGAWFLERLTDDLARAGWAAFRRLEAEGGLVAGFDRLAAEVASVRTAREAALEAGEAVMIGVNAFPDAAEPPPPPAGPPPTGRFAPVRLAAPFEAAATEVAR